MFLFFIFELVFQQLEIDYIIADTHKELLPSSSGPAAILRIFGVLKKVYLSYLLRITENRIVELLFYVFPLMRTYKLHD